MPKASKKTYFPPSALRFGCVDSEGPWFCDVFGSEIRLLIQLTRTAEYAAVVELSMPHRYSELVVGLLNIVDQTWDQIKDLSMQTGFEPSDIAIARQRQHIDNTIASLREAAQNLNHSSSFRQEQLGAAHYSESVKNVKQWLHALICQLVSV